MPNETSTAAPNARQGATATPEASRAAEYRRGDAAATDTKSAAFTAVTGLSANTSVYRFTAPRDIKEADPPLFLLESKEERHLSRISQKEGRATLTVIQNAAISKDGVDLKSGQIKPGATKTGFIMKYKTADFFVQSIQSGNAETFGIDKNDIGFTLHAPGSNPEMLSVNGTFLNGSDYTQRFATPGMIIDTDWFSKFIYDYETQLKASASIRNGDRIFFNCRGTTYEVYIIGLTTMESAENPDGVSFAMQMVVKRKILAPKTLSAIQQIEAKQQDFFVTSEKDGKKFSRIKLPKDYKVIDGKIIIPAGKGEKLLGSVIAAAKRFSSRG